MQRYIFCVKNTHTQKKGKGKIFYRLNKKLSQSIAGKVVPDITEKAGNSEHIHYPCSPEGAVIAKMLSQDTTNQYPQSHAHIPADKH